MFMDYNLCIYQVIQKELKLESTAIHKIIHEELRMKKVVFYWVSYNLTDHKKRSVVFFDVPTRHESKLRVFEDDHTPTIVKRQRVMKIALYTVFFKKILQEVNVRELMFHYGNASYHTAGLTVEFLRQKKKIK
ncbi:UNVERIFIED_CONTAM: hypothetical protein NCL1_26265 [Trichonephila clavipes]